VLEENLLEAKKANRLVAICPEDRTAGFQPASSAERGSGTTSDQGSGEDRPPLAGKMPAVRERRFGLASVDLANGCIFIQELEGEAALRSEFTRHSPSECLLPDDPLLPSGQKVP